MADLLSLLLTNPHGLDNSPLKYGQSQGEIRNADDPYYGTGGPSVPASLAYMLSGIPMGIEGAQKARQGSLEGDPIKAAGGIGQAALAAVPGMGKAAEPLVATAPRLAALLTAGTAAPMAAEGAFSSSPAAAADASNPLPGLYADRQRLSGQIAQTTQARDAEGRTGKGPKYQALDAEVQRLAGQQAGLDQMIQAKEKENSPEHAQDLAQRQKQIDDQNAADELNKPFQERHPNVALGMTLGAPVASAVLARYGLNKIADQGKSLLSELLQARQAGDVVGVQEAASRLARWKGTVLPKQAAAVAIPSTLPVDMRALGDNIDKYSLPTSSPAQQDAAARLDNLPQYAKDAVPAIVSGLTGGFVGAKTARSAPRGDAAAMGDIYGGKDPATLSQILQEGANATTSVQAPIARAQSAMKDREAAVASAGQRNQQLGNAAGQVEDAALASSPDHHSSLQPRNKKGRFAGPPLRPENDK